MKEITIRVPDATCQMCFRTVEKALLSVKGAKEVRVKPQTKEFVVKGEALINELLAAVRAAGYHPEV